MIQKKNNFPWKGEFPAVSIPYRLIRSHRKTLALQITRQGEVLVRAPHRISQDTIDQLILEKEDWVRTHLARRQTWLTEHPDPSPAEEAALRLKAQEIIPPLVAQYAHRMGLTPRAITITGARTRFGSCSGADRLCFSWRLMQYPGASIEYVVVHELAHIVHKNHGPDFYAYVEGWMPDWKARQALLRP